MAVSAITIAEMLLGAELAEGRHARIRHDWIDDVLGIFFVEDYGLDIARVHAALLAHSRRAGKARGAHDLIVAATAVATARTLVTLDRAGFEDLPGVELSV